MMNEILNAIWQHIQPMIGEIIFVVISIILTKIGMPKLFNKGLGLLFSYIPYKPVEAMAWGLVRHLAEKYKDELPGQAKADRIFKEIKEHYAWFPDKKLMAIIKTQYRAWQGQLVEEKKGRLCLKLYKTSKVISKILSYVEYGTFKTSLTHQTYTGIKFKIRW